MNSLNHYQSPGVHCHMGVHSVPPSPDTASPFPEGPGKVKFLIVVMDYFTKWIKAKALATITGEHVKKFAWDNIVCRSGIPDEIVSDNGKQFCDNPFKDCGEEVFVCSTSQIDTDKLTNWIETDKCLQARGLNCNVLGISSDSLLESNFTQKLCSTQCYNSCPNIVDLYFNLAAGEGVYLPSLCQTQGDNKRKGKSEIRSSEIVAPGPVAPVKLLTDGSPIMARPPQDHIS
nr:hypothetical protein [Tanacetum cinerariifolium]